MLQKKIYILFCALLSSILSFAGNDSEQPKDTTALFRGVSVSVDAAGAALVHLSDYGQYEAALRINLKDRYFPVFELGYGVGEHEEDVVTGMAVKAKAPYFRVGLDFNVMKNKHDIYRIYAGVRYGHTSFDTDITNNAVEDPIWGGKVDYNILSEKTNYHWAEGVFGVDAKIVGPFRMGWSVRYRRRIASTDHDCGNIWYVPGYGVDDKNLWGGTLNLTLEL